MCNSQALQHIQCRPGEGRDP